MKVLSKLFGIKKNKNSKIVESINFNSNEKHEKVANLTKVLSNFFGINKNKKIKK